MDMRGVHSLSVILNGTRVMLYRFHWLSFFLKTTDKKWGSITVPCNDPLMRFPENGMAQLYYPDRPQVEGFIADVKFEVNPQMLETSEKGLIMPIHMKARTVFDLLSKKWEESALKLFDLKLEFGINPDGELLLADVVDPDSWRLIDKDGTHYDKQCWRDGGSLDELSKRYQRIAFLSRDFPA